MRIIPPGSGIIHQVNLEYLARVVFDQDGCYYPDSLVGTDSHTTMIDGLGVLGWGESSPTFLWRALFWSTHLVHCLCSRGHRGGHIFVDRHSFQCLENKTFTFYLEK